MIKILGFKLIRKKEEENSETVFEVKRKYDLLLIGFFANCEL